MYGLMRDLSAGGVVQGTWLLMFSWYAVIVLSFIWYDALYEVHANRDVSENMILPIREHGNFHIW